MATGVGGAFNSLPGGRSTSELADDILNYVGLPDDPDARKSAMSGVNAAIRQLNTRSWEWSNTYDDITLTAGTFDYSLPRDVNKPMHVERLNSSSQPDGRLWFKDPKTILVEHTRATGNGNPTNYT